MYCDIPFYVGNSDYLYYLHCWENGVLKEPEKGKLVEPCNQPI